MWKWIIGVAVVLVLVVGGAVGVFFAAGGPAALAGGMKRTEKAIDVRLEKPERGRLIKTVSAPGTIEPKTRVPISAQVTARIIALPFRDGDNVKKGDVLVRLDSVELAARLEQAKSQLKGVEAQHEGAKASLALAELELGRARELYATSDISKSELDEAESRHRQAVASLASAAAAIEGAMAEIIQREKDLANAVIASPIDGTIIKVNSEVGELVLGTFNNIGTEILQIADLSVMMSRAKVDEANVGPVKPGQKAKVFITSFADRTFTGTVELVKRQKEIDRDGTGFFATDIVLDLPEEIRLVGPVANSEIEVETFEDVLKVPSQAVQDRRVDELPKEVTTDNPHIDKDKAFTRVVFKFVDGKAKVTPVRTGPSDLTHTVILAGLTDEDKVVTGPFKILLELKHDRVIAEQGVAKPGTTGPVEAKEAAATTTGGTG